MKKAEALSFLLLFMGVGSWLTALETTSIISVSPEALFGLASVLPLSFWLGLAFAVLSFVVCSQASGSEKLKERLFLFQALLIIAITTWTPLLIEPNARTGSAWYHFGEARYIIDYGHIAPLIIGYHQWPLWFILTAMLNLTSNMPVSLLLKSGVIAFSIFYFLVLLAISSQIYSTALQRYTFILLFTFANWIGQTYWCPQYVTYLIYMILWMLILRFPTKGWSRRMATIFMFLFVATTMTHPLTPIPFILSLFVLKVMKSNYTSRVPLVFLTIFFMAWGYMSFFAIQEFIGILPKTFALQDILFTGETGRLYYSAPSTIVRLYVKGLLTALVSCAFLFGLISLRTMRNMVKLIIGWIVGISIFGITVRFSMEILERFILFSLIPICIMTAFLSGGKGSKYKIAFRLIPIALILVAAPLNVVGTYANESFDIVPNSMIRAHSFFVAYTQTSAVFDQSQLLSFYDFTKYQIQSFEIGANITELMMPRSDYYILDAWTFNYFRYFVGTSIAKDFQEQALVSPDFNLVYDSGNTKILLITGPK